MAALGTLTICFTGTLSKPRSAMEADCAAAGVPTSSDIRARTTHLIATTNEIAANVTKVQKALKKQIPIVTEAFLRDSLAAGTVVQDLTPYILVKGGATAAAANAAQVAAAKLAIPAPSAATRLGAAEAANVMLAHKFVEGKVDPTGWHISEKLDGVRAYWSGEGFYSRNGNRFNAPAWYTKDFPKEPLDGELWAGRGQFNIAISVAKSGTGDMSRWKDISYAVFDAPKLTQAGGQPMQYEERLAWIDAKLKEKKSYAFAVGTMECTGQAHLDVELKKIEKQNGEGLMLRKAGSLYEHKRSRTLLKVKSFHDEEGIVVGSKKGSGKNSNVCGALLLKTPDGRDVTVGSGLTDAERKDPPKNGAVVTYKYFEVSKSGAPRFPTFVCVRTDLDWDDYCKTYTKPTIHDPGSLKRQHSIMYGKKMGRTNSVDSVTGGGGGAAGAADDDDDAATTDDDDGDADADAAAFGADDDDSDDDGAGAGAGASAGGGGAGSGAGGGAGGQAKKKQKMSADSDDDDADDDDGDAPEPCKFGAGCYRSSNKAHCAEFSHPNDTKVKWSWAGDSDPVNNPGTQDTQVEYSKAVSDQIEAAFLKKGGSRNYKLDAVRFINFDDMAQCRYDDPNRQRAVFRTA